MNRHTMEEMLHDTTTHEVVRRMEFWVVLAATIAVVYALMYRVAF